MPDLSGILNIGRQAVQTHQRALSVTSNNVSNVNTPGYTRQETIYANADPTGGIFGNGVEVQQVRRAADHFLANQITSQESILGQLEIEKRLLDRVEAAFNDANGEGISKAISDFFAAVNDLANNPAGITERSALIEKAELLARTLRTTDEQLTTIRNDANTEIIGRVGEVNVLAQSIAELNKEIRVAESAGQDANDLRDERARLITELAEKIDVQTLENEGGELTVVVGNGGNRSPLVSGDQAYALSVVSDPDNVGFARILFNAEIDITDSIAGGRLKGLIALRDNILPGFSDQLDQLAASIVNEFNFQHRAGFNLDGGTGIDFFAPLEPTVEAFSSNRGDATVTVEINLGSLEELEEIEGEGTIDLPGILTFNDYELVFSKEEFVLRNLTTGETSTDFSDTPFQGLQLTIEGEAVEGDRFRISVHKNTAGKISVSLSDPRKIATSLSEEGLPGENTNILALSALQDKALRPFDAVSLQDFYGRFVGEVGARVQSAQRNLAVEEITMEKLSQMREEVSGVSLDEEMTNLIKFQRAYEASARLVTLADELLETIIGLKR